MQQRTDYITDPNDFCRACRGVGTENHESPTGRYVVDDCYLCGGTGTQSVRLTSQPHEVAA